jgi:bifunctional DNA-binding transcriptional regulator/antitoxin component of YhaV-PrlF toxin-antitoxin module
MTKQERKFTLGEVHTKMGIKGEVHLDPTFLDVLGIKPNDFIIFTISPEGVVTVRGEKKAVLSKAPTTTSSIPTDVTQATLFDAGQPNMKPSRQRRRNI